MKDKLFLIAILAGLLLTGGCAFPKTTKTDQKTPLAVEPSTPLDLNAAILNFSAQIGINP